MSEAEDEARIVAVTDTNVLLDLASCHDLSTSDDPDVESQRSIYRRQRARDAVILAMLFDRDSAATFNLADETRSKFQQIIDPSANSLETAFTTTFWHFVKDATVPRWEMLTDVDFAKDVRASNADDSLLSKAQKLGVPLISSEGFQVNGTRQSKRKNIRKKAEELGVRAVTPREFFSGQIDEEEATCEFMQRFLLKREAYVTGHAFPREMRGFFADFLTGYYQHILFGVTNGFARSVAVMLGPPSSS